MKAVGEEVSGVVKSEREAKFDRFYRRNYRLILTTVEHRVYGYATAEDVTSEVFRIAWQQYTSGGELRLAWLYGVVRNVVGNEYRRSARSNNLIERLRGPGTIGAPDTTEASLEVLLALRKLRELDREILYLTYWDDLTRDEVAIVLKITTVTVRVRLMRARKALQRILTRDDPRVESRMKTDDHRATNPANRARNVPRLPSFCQANLGDLEHIKPAVQNAPTRFNGPANTQEAHQAAT